VRKSLRRFYVGMGCAVAYNSDTSRLKIQLMLVVVRPAFSAAFSLRADARSANRRTRSGSLHT